MKELELIQLYYYLCECYNKELFCYCQRFSNNSNPKNEKITDEELLCIYFYCRCYEQRHSKKGIHDFAERFMKSWFPSLPNYANFNSRLNQLHSVILGLISITLEHIENQAIVTDVQPDILLVDSFPIMLCSGKRKGKVAPELSDKSYCATKNQYYYGLKMHTIARKVKKKLPLISFISITAASENDLSALRPILPQLAGKAIFADKAYTDSTLNKQLIETQNTHIFTPVKLVKGESEAIRQFKKAADDLFSTAVSTVRQPIEALFNWINELTGLQNASKIRTINGLLVHIFGAISTCLLKIAF